VSSHHSISLANETCVPAASYRETRFSANGTVNRSRIFGSVLDIKFKRHVSLRRTLRDVRGSRNSKFQEHRAIAATRGRNDPRNRGGRKKKKKGKKDNALRRSDTRSLSFSD